MLPGFRFLFTAIMLSLSILIFGLGAAALLRAAHEEVASNPSWRATPEMTFAQQPEATRPDAARPDAARPVLAMFGSAPAELRGPFRAAEPETSPRWGKRIHRSSRALDPKFRSRKPGTARDCTGSGRSFSRSVQACDNECFVAG
jgi:hypothetical protein